MKFSRTFLVLQCASFLATGTNAWTMPQPLRSNRGLVAQRMAQESDDEKEFESFDKVQVTTKTNKQLVFDEGRGRFFETSLEPQMPITAAVSSSYEIPADISISPAFTSNEMVCTKALFGRTKEEDEEQLPELVAALEEAVVPEETPPTKSNTPDAAKRSDISNSPAFSSSEMVPTKVLFGRTNTEDDEEQLPELVAALEEASTSPTPEDTEEDQEDLPELVAALEEVQTSSTPEETALTQTNTPFTSNEMVPTKVLFGRTSEEDEEQLPELVAALEEATTSPTQEETALPQTNTPNDPERSIVEQCYAAWNQRDMTAMVECFADRFQYQDSQYLGTISDKRTLRQHYENGSKLVPDDSRIVLENIAVDPINGNIGTQWHLETQDGTPIPLTRGCAFYQTNEAGLISQGFKVSEMLVKPNKQAADRLVASVSRLTGGRTQQLSPPTKKSAPNESNSALNIIEQYFVAWNRRDMESALECFVDDCTYQTEDPVFVDTFQGKATLRAHLIKNAASLPAACRIVLDQIAADPQRGTIATRWHLEVSGIALPNLSGCSMYTTDPTTGLLKSGFDVTEAPVKVPRQVLQVIPTQLLGLPARALFGRQ